MKLTSSHAAVLANLIFKRLDERLKRVESLSDKNNFELQSLKSEMEMIKDEAAFLSQEERPTIDTSIPLLEELKLAWLGLVEGYYIDSTDNTPGNSYNDFEKNKSMSEIRIFEENLREKSQRESSPLSQYPTPEQIEEQKNEARINNSNFQNSSTPTFRPNEPPSDAFSGGNQADGSYDLFKSKNDHQPENKHSRNSSILNNSLLERLSITPYLQHTPPSLVEDISKHESGGEPIDPTLKIDVKPSEENNKQIFQEAKKPQQVQLIREVHEIEDKDDSYYLSKSYANIYMKKTGRYYEEYSAIKKRYSALGLKQITIRSVTPSPKKTRLDKTSEVLQVNVTKTKSQATLHPVLRSPMRSRRSIHDICKEEALKLPQREITPSRAEEIQKIDQALNIDKSVDRTNPNRTTVNLSLSMKKSRLSQPGIFSQIDSPRVKQKFNQNGSVDEKTGEVRVENKISLVNEIITLQQRKSLEESQSFSLDNPFGSSFLKDGNRLSSPTQNNYIDNYIFR